MKLKYAAQAVWRDGNDGDSVRALRFARINSRAKSQAVIECFVTGLLAWRDGQPGQVGNEAATAVFHQCRGSGSSPSSFCSFCFLPLARCHRVCSRCRLPMCCCSHCTAAHSLRACSHTAVHVARTMHNDAPRCRQYIFLSLH